MTMADWFSYLGPSGFLATIIGDFREGRSVVLQVPRHTHLGLLDAIRCEATKENQFDWIELDNTRDAPLALVWKTFGSSISPTTPEHKVKALYDIPAFQNRIIVPLNVTPDKIQNWLEFMELFAHVSRGIDPFRRTEFLLLIEAGNKPIVKKSDPLLYNRIADNLVHKWDTLYRTHAHLHSVTKSVTEKQLHAEVAAALALWDDRLCATLCNFRLDQLMNPIGYLSDYARELQWQDLASANEERLWMEGVCQTYAGRMESHSAFLALHNLHNQLEERIWKAQVTVLLPLIEQCRQTALMNYGYLLDVPHEDGHGSIIRDVKDLEVSHILYQLNSKKRNGFVQEKAILAALRNARNALAHGETVAANDLRVIMSTSPSGGAR